MLNKGKLRAVLSLSEFLQLCSMDKAEERIDFKQNCNWIFLITKHILSNIFTRGHLTNWHYYATNGIKVKSIEACFSHLMIKRVWNLKMSWAKAFNFVMISWGRSIGEIISIYVYRLLPDHLLRISPKKLNHIFSSYLRWSSGLWRKWSVLSVPECCIRICSNPPPPTTTTTIKKGLYVPCSFFRTAHACSSLWHLRGAKFSE